MLTALAERARRIAAVSYPWTNVYGLARSLLAVSTLATLCFNSSDTLFRVGVRVAMDPPFCDGIRGASLFCWPIGTEVARFVGIVILVVVASGWRPRITGPLHWLVAFSLHASSSVADGGDNVCAVLTLLLLPITLTDARIWHWSRSRATSADETHEASRRLIALSAWWAIRLQVAGIYFHAAVGKLEVQEWVDGTALYYWLLHPTIGAPHWLVPLVRPLMLHGAVVASLTWAVLAVELLLFMALVMSRRRWAPLLVLGCGLHSGILVLHGLVSFSTAMFAALILYLRPLERDFLPSREGTVRSRLFKSVSAQIRSGLFASIDHGGDAWIVARVSGSPIFSGAGEREAGEAEEDSVAGVVTE